MSSRKRHKISTGSGADAQLTRYMFAIDLFQRRYGSHYDTNNGMRIFRAPGRVNLIGEHTDYNHGYVMPAALDKDFLLLAAPRDDNCINLLNIESRFPEVHFEIGQEIPIGEPGNWGNYARGAAQVMAQAMRKPFTGFDGLIVGASPHGIPVGSGLSSSSALTVVMMVALAHFAQWEGDKVELVQFSSDAEWYVGTRGGIMDQFAALLAQKDHALFLDCRPDERGAYQTEAIPLPTGYRLMVVDSGVHHENSRGEFNQRVAAGRAGVALLSAAYPGITHLRDVESVDWAELEPQLPEDETVASLNRRGIELTDIPGLTAHTLLKIRSRCRHVWSENRRVLDAVTALETGNMAQLGKLLNAAHESARDDYEISCPEIEVLVTAAAQQAGVVGARLTGAGWGGCIIALVEEGTADGFSRQIQRMYRAETGKHAAVFACQTTPGAGLILHL